MNKSFKENWRDMKKLKEVNWKGIDKRVWVSVSLFILFLMFISLIIAYFGPSVLGNIYSGLLNKPVKCVLGPGEVNAAIIISCYNVYTLSDARPFKNDNPLLGIISTFILLGLLIVSFVVAYKIFNNYTKKFRK